MTIGSSKEVTLDHLFKYYDFNEFSISGSNLVRNIYIVLEPLETKGKGNIFFNARSCNFSSNKFPYSRSHCKRGKEIVNAGETVRLKVFSSVPETVYFSV